MAMKAMDLVDEKLEELRADYMKAFESDNREDHLKALDALMDYKGQQLRKEYELLESEMDYRIRAGRGERVQTAVEKKYFTTLARCMKAKDPREVLTNVDLVMPETVFNGIFDDLRTRHPLLNKIRFQNTNGAIRFLLNLNGYQRAAWGKLCAEIIQELTSGFKEVDATLLKLSAFIPMCKAMLDLGPEWLERYLREIMYEAIANGLEYGLVNGSGKDEPVGMIRQVGDGVAVVDGVYPEKAAVKVTSFDLATMGNLSSILAAHPNGQARDVDDLILLVNPQDYFQKVGPATQMLTPQGSYVNTMPYDVQVIRSAALPRGKAVFGMARLYLAFVGMAKEGRIEYSDENRFLEDERVYLIKTYANGMPADNNAFLVLDISGLKPATYKVEVTTPGEPSDNATLSDLKIGSAKLTPAFSPDTTSYTAETANATNAVTAVPAAAGSEIHVTVNGKEIDNGTSASWQSGSNTVEVAVTAEDGTTEKTYTVTVTQGA